MDERVQEMVKAVTITSLTPNVPRRKNTLKAIVESALRREIRPATAMENPDPDKNDIEPFEILRLKRKPGETISLEQIRAIPDELDDEELRRAIAPRRA